MVSGFTAEDMANGEKGVPVAKPEQAVTLDINAAILAVSRLAKREVATPAAILAALLKEIGSDALTREVRAAQRETWK